MISGDEVTMLQFVYTTGIKYFYQTLGPIMERLCSLYGPSIDCPSIRAAVLAYATARKCSTSCSRYEGQFAEYSIRAHRALIQKDRSSFDSEEFYTSFFLTLAEHVRLLGYSRIDRPSAETAIARVQFAVYVNGTSAIVDHLMSRPEAARSVKSGDVWVYAQDILAYVGSFANPVNVVKAASFYKRHLPEVKNDHDISGTSSSFQGSSATFFRFVTISNMIAGLTRTMLRGFLLDPDGRRSLQDGAIRELKDYWVYAETLGIGSPIALDHIKWCDLQISRAAYFASKLLVHLATDSSKCTPNSEDYSCAQALVKLTRNIHTLLSQHGHMTEWDHHGAFTAVSIAALIIPPEDHIECEPTKFCLPLLTTRSRFGDWVPDYLRLCRTRCCRRELLEVEGRRSFSEASLRNFVSFG
jgi:hypothetical protein